VETFSQVINVLSSILKITSPSVSPALGRAAMEASRFFARKPMVAVLLRHCSEETSENAGYSFLIIIVYLSNSCIHG
jgi:hypothetical protein